MGGLTKAQREMLTEAAGAATIRWLRGPRWNTFHSLERRGLTERSIAVGFVTLYRITPAGRAALTPQKMEGGDGPR